MPRPFRSGGADAGCQQEQNWEGAWPRGRTTTARAVSLVHPGGGAERGSLGKHPQASSPAPTALVQTGSQTHGGQTVLAFTSAIRSGMVSQREHSGRAQGAGPPKILSGSEVPGLGVGGVQAPSPPPRLNRPESNLPSVGLRNHRTEPFPHPLRESLESTCGLAILRDRVRGWGSWGTYVLASQRRQSLNFRSPKLAPLTLRSIHYLMSKIARHARLAYLEAA